MPESPQLLVGVLPSRQQAGVEDPETPVLPLDVFELEEAFLNLYETDAHFVCYRPTHRGRWLDQWPRINKGSLAQLRAREGEVRSTMLVYDVDNEGHAPHTEAGLERWRRALDVVEPAPACRYVTRHGVRLVYVLAEPVKVERAEELWRGLARHLRQEHDLACDPTCGDWTRIFRLPCVTREGASTWEDECFDMQADWSLRLDASTIVALPKQPGPDSPVPAQRLNLPKPDPDEAEALMWVRPGKATEFRRAARRRLQNRDCFDAAFSPSCALPPKGTRHKLLLEYAGQACALLHNVPGASPQAVYALLRPWVEQFEDCAEEPTDHWWGLVCYCWAREDAEAERREEEEAVASLQRDDKMARILRAVKGWCRHPAMELPEDEAIEWMSRHAIACTPAKVYHVLRPDGYYDAGGVPAAHLPMRVRELDMQDVIRTHYQNQKGEWKAYTAQQLVTNHGTSVSTVGGSIHTDGSYIADIEGERARLMLRLFALRRDLEPQYDPDVERWLNLLVPEQDQDLLTQWIAHALAFREGPICALSIAGPPGVGKNLLTRGLAECVDTGLLAEGKDLIGEFPIRLTQTPFLVVNEGLPRRREGLDVADSFRAMVDGSQITVNLKFRDHMTVSNPLRIVFTANNLDVIHTLTGNRDLTPDDQAALALRILHLRARQEAADWLLARGGLRFTAAHGRRWIAGADGSPSDHVVARHFLWLHANRTEPPGTRLLVEGNFREDLVREMRVRSGSAPHVVEAVVRMVEQPDNGTGVVVTDDGVFVTTSGVVEWHRRRLDGQRRIDQRAVQSVLRGLSVAGCDGRTRTLTLASGETLRARWHELDVRVLHDEAVEHGLPSQKLSALMEARCNT